MKTFLLIGLLGMLSCQNQTSGKMPTPEQLEKWKAEIRQAETDFATMTAEQGMPAAFLHFAAEDAVLNRNGKAIKGKAAINSYFQEQTLTQVKLAWIPDFVDVSAAGDMAYTYGKFVFSAIDQEGNSMKSEGVFHTVWKRQADGGWKYVYD